MLRQVVVSVISRVSLLPMRSAHVAQPEMGDPLKQPSAPPHEQTLYSEASLLIEKLDVHVGSSVIS